MLVVELAQAGGHLAAAGAGSGDHHQGAGGLDEIIGTEALVGDDMGHIVGVARDGVVAVAGDAAALELLAEGGGGGGGTTNYNDLENKPQIGGTTLIGNKSLGELGIKTPKVIGEQLIFS